MKEYDEYARWTTTKIEDDAARKKGKGYADNWYFLIGRNCEDVVGGIAKAAGISWKDKFLPKSSWKANKGNSDTNGKINFYLYYDALLH